MTEPAPRSRVRIGIGAAIVLVLVALACAVLFSATAPRGSSAVVAPSGPAGASPGASPGFAGSAAGTGIFVHILGAVSRPGLYELRDGDRAVDAVAAAGGFTDDADQTALNLARFVSDGEQIVVPVIGAVPTGDAGVAPGGTGGGGASGGTDPGDKVNLNTADEATLETLPRVGPAMAQRIIAWRDENGRFTAVDDLKSITGIGDKTFEALEDLVTI